MSIEVIVLDGVGVGAVFGCEFSFFLGVLVIFVFIFEVFISVMELFIYIRFRFF